MTGAGHFLSITLISSGKEEFFKNLHTALLFICFFLFCKVNVAVIEEL